MPPTAKITLLVPCYNAARYLPRLLESVRALTSPFDAILCYDDGSRDDTVVVARQLGLDIITGQPNAGVSVARNRLAAAAQTEWIHFHDADDLIAPSFVAQLAPNCNDAHDVVSCDADWIDENTRALIIAWRYQAEELARAPLVHLLTQPMGLNSSIIRRAAWEGVGGCDERLKMWEDADLHIRLARSGARFHHVPEVLTWSLRCGASFSHDYRTSWNCRLAALENYAADQSNESITLALAAEAEKAAANLILLDDEPAARRSLKLCTRLGGNPPSTRHPLLRILKIFVPAYPLFRWQCRRRQAAARSAGHFQA